MRLISYLSWRQSWTTISRPSKSVENETTLAIWRHKTEQIRQDQNGTDSVEQSQDTQMCRDQTDREEPKHRRLRSNFQFPLHHYGHARMSPTTLRHDLSTLHCNDQSHHQSPAACLRYLKILLSSRRSRADNTDQRPHHRLGRPSLLTETTGSSKRHLSDQILAALRFDLSAIRTGYHRCCPLPPSRCHLRHRHQPQHRCRRKGNPQFQVALSTIARLRK